MLRKAKAHVLDTLFAGEFNVLAKLLARIAAGHRSTRDLPPNGLRKALRAYITEFPVYRTYAAGDDMPAADRRIVEQTLERIRASGTAADEPLLTFLREALTLELIRRRRGHSPARIRQLVMKLQQLTGPVMAKSLEDTSLYRDHRLLALNEVGNEPSLPAHEAVQRVRLHETPPAEPARHQARPGATAHHASQDGARGRITSDPNAPGQHRPTVLEGANGVSLVNITTPSAAGVSRNVYSRFDVDPEGVILNNSRTRVETELGGWIQGNPWLATGTARVILNEVTSSDPSRLRGYVEVGGDRAQVVIANPAGIDCDGCGFINASRLTLTTGAPVVDNGVLEGYRVDGGTIVVHGAGLDATRTDYTDLIARSLRVNAGIWAERLQVVAGANEVGAADGGMSVNAVEPTGPAPGFAIDVGALGGMYAGKITLLGTEHGVGVRNAGNIGAQVGELTVTVGGRLENAGALQSRQHDTRIDTVGGVANAGMLGAARELQVATASELDNSGGTLNARRIEVTAQSLRNDGGAIEQTGVQALVLEAGTLSNRAGGRIGMAAAPVGGSAPGGGDGPGTPGEVAMRPTAMTNRYAE